MIIDSLRDRFSGNSYHLIRKNCNTFTNALATAILNAPIPSWIDRMAGIGRFFLITSDFFAMRTHDPKF